MTLSFKRLAKGADHLPRNYLPAALPALLGAGKMEDRALLPSPATANGSKRNAVAVSKALLGDPSALSAHIQSQGDGEAYFLGPKPVNPGRKPGGSVAAGVGSASNVTVVIDSGIAFWNPAFGPGGSFGTFEDLAFLELGGKPSTLPKLRWIGAGRIQSAQTSARTIAGEQALLAQLAADYPESVYADHPEAGRIYHPNLFNHGTAVVDLAGRSATAAPAIFGVELPSTALIDASGDTLQALLALAVEGAIARIKAWHAAPGALDVKIVIPFAFLGGPHDGTHPIVKTLEDCVDAASSSAFSVSVFVPAGNHLQDQLHVAIGDLKSGRASKKARWYMQPDDFSASTVEMTFKGASGLTLELGSPDGEIASVKIKAGEVHLLRSSKTSLGAVCAQHLGQGTTRIRLALAGTAATEARLPIVTTGDWTLRVKASEGAVKDLHFWALREDGNRFSRKSPPARQSYFKDFNYLRKVPYGGFAKSDTPDAMIKRAGSISVLATSSHAAITAVTALETVGLQTEVAWYAGQRIDGTPITDAVLVDANPKSPGVVAHANGAPRLQRMSGTSAAAAIAAKHS